MVFIRLDDHGSCDCIRSAFLLGTRQESSKFSLGWTHCDSVTITFSKLRINFPDSIETNKISQIRLFTSTTCHFLNTRKYCDNLGTCHTLFEKSKTEGKVSEYTHRQKWRKCPPSFCYSFFIQTEAN